MIQPLFSSQPTIHRPTVAQYSPPLEPLISLGKVDLIHLSAPANGPHILKPFHISEEIVPAIPHNLKFSRPRLNREHSRVSLEDRQKASGIGSIPQFRRIHSRILTRDDTKPSSSPFQNGVQKNTATKKRVKFSPPSPNVRRHGEGGVTSVSSRHHRIGSPPRRADIFEAQLRASMPSGSSISSDESFITSSQVFR